jgi:hypothetical protein
MSTGKYGFKIRCIHCGGPHDLMQCQDLTPEQATDIALEDLVRRGRAYWVKRDPDNPKNDEIYIKRADEK